MDSHEDRSEHITESLDNIFQGRQLADKTGKGQPGVAYSQLQYYRATGVTLRGAERQATETR
jgi:hypothetical protein